MQGLNMDLSLQISRLLDHAANHCAETEVIGRRINGSVERETWATMRERALRSGHALHNRGFRGETPIATLAWNTLDHLEVLYAGLSMGVPVHTLNGRLSVDDLVYMIDKVGDSLCFVDSSMLSLATAISRATDTIEHWVVLDADTMEVDRTESGLPRAVGFDEFVADASGSFEWPSLDENAAATICFTSGSTGRPKGVVYSHRSLTLTAMNMSMAGMYSCLDNGEQVRAMPLAPIFHANGWLMPFTAPMNGNALILPGRDFSPAGLIELIRAEGVTLAAGVPTLWNDMLGHLETNDIELPSLRIAHTAGTAMPASIHDRLVARGIEVRATWGMTEVPSGTYGSLPPGTNRLTEDGQRALRVSRQGRVTFLADLRIVDQDGRRLPHDGVAVGRLEVRGPIATSRYLGEPEGEARAWLDTGDIARLHPDGSLEIVDRAKDVIKSGGEWISSPQLEAAAMSHDAVDIAAAIGVAHPRWQERPLLICTLKPGMSVTEDELRDHMGGEVANWWLPEAIQFIGSMPTNATGKVDKLVLRERFGGSGEEMG